MIAAHIILMAVTIRATADLTAGTLVRYTGDYNTAKPVLGMVLADCKSGELASIGVKGQFQVKIAASQAFAAGDPLALNSAGLGITGSTGIAFVTESTPTSATIIL